MTTTDKMSLGATEPRRSGKSRRRYRMRRTLVPYGMLTPAIVLFVAFLAAPIAYTLILSFQKVKIVGLGLGSGSRSTVFAGFANYANALSDPELWASTGRVAIYGLILIITLLGFALLLALLLDSRRTRATRFSRIGLFLPFAVPAVISSLMWGFLYLPGVSPLSYLMGLLGRKAPNPLDDWPVVFAIANIGFWGGVGFNMLIIYTALRTIPSDIYEAARIDGASEVQIGLRIKIPLVVPSLILTSLFAMVGVLQVFTEPMLLQPLTNSIATTWSPLMKVYRDAFIKGDIHSAAATSIVIAAVTIVLSFIFLRVVQRRAFAQE
jgi:multiple sugar transport system permease protein